jgi:uncharacterized membrane protein
MWTTRTKLGWGAMAAGVVLLVLISARYFTRDPEVYFPRQRAVYEALTGVLLVHIGAMSVAALTGPLQLLRVVRSRRPLLHRITGRLYLASATIGAVAGLYLAPFSASGWISDIGFALLALGVLAATSRAFWLILHRQIQAHREWMTRSYALILAAVTLRLHNPFLEAALGEQAGYAVVAWACWVPNLLVAEWLIRHHLRKAPERAMLAPAAAFA